MDEVFPEAVVHQFGRAERFFSASNRRASRMLSRARETRPAMATAPITAQMNPMTPKAMMRLASTYRP